jgi:hypothetical protein
MQVRTAISATAANRVLRATPGFGAWLADKAIVIAELLSGLGYAVNVLTLLPQRAGQISMTAHQMASIIGRVPPRSSTEN